MLPGPGDMRGRWFAASASITARCTAQLPDLPDGLRQLRDKNAADE